MSSSEPLSFRLDGHTAIVTGGSTGLGLEAVEQLRLAGADAWIVDRIPPVGSSSERYAECDVTNHAAMRDVLAEIPGERLVLVNNVGIGAADNPDDIDPADWANVLGTNVTAAVNAASAIAPRMARGAGGAIVNVASIFAMRGVDPAIYRTDEAPAGAHYTAYAASKGAVITATRTLARYWGPRGIRVNCISPGMFDNQHSTVLRDPSVAKRLAVTAPLGRIGQPRDFAAAVVFLASDAAAFITGVNLPVDGGWTA